MAYVPKINPQTVILGYKGKSPAATAQIIGYINGGKKQG